jgi:hypothetical protein
LGWLWWVGAAGFVAIIIWWGGEPDRPDGKEAPAAVAERGTRSKTPSRTAAKRDAAASPDATSAKPAAKRHGASLSESSEGTRSATISLADRPPAPPPAVDPPAAPAPGPAAATAPVAEPEEQPAPVPPRPPLGDIRRAPAGASETAAAAFARIPKARDDRAPLGGIADTGLHVDRLSLGTEFDRGECRGSKTGFSTATHDYVHFCFRVVHPRQVEYVLVKWERGGSVERRAWVRIPDDHAYRTRAGLSLRKAEPGGWVVRVESATGTELASTKFEIKR